MKGRECALAVVIPTLNEAELLPDLLGDLASLDADVVVVDGGSTDDTRAVATSAGARVVVAGRGRAKQLRAGAAATDAPWLFFVHADCRVPPESLETLTSFLERAGLDEYACFRFALEGDALFFRFIELGQWLREGLFGLPYGDQGLVISRAKYDEVSGYPEWPILEDVGIIERLRGRGTRRRLAALLPTSPRRFDTEGRYSGWLRNIGLMALYKLGVTPERLARWYPPQGASGPTPKRKRAVIVFAKAPRPGYVKTRLAADLGPDEAVRIYRTLGRRTLDALRSGSESVFVYYDPPDPEALAEIQAWLGSDRIEYRPQVSGDLGERMARAFDERLAEADRVCIVGTDVPGIGPGTLEEAFRSLETHDVVVGPATDGGYYLVGLRETRPELFREIPWSTGAVLETTLARAREVGADVGLLATRTDVDTKEDVPRELLMA